MRSSATAGGASTASGPAPRSDTTTGLRHRLGFEDRPLQAFRLDRGVDHDRRGRERGRQVVDRAGHADDVGRAGGEHQIPEFAGVARLALVLADEHAQEILQAHLLEPAHRLDHDVMTLAAEHAADDQDDLGLGLDAPGAPHGVDRAPAIRAPDRIARNRCWPE